MNKLAKSIAAMMLVSLAGCSSMHMFNNPTADMTALKEIDVPQSVGLYLTPAFSEYSYEGTAGGEMGSLCYSLGPASVLLFEDALARVTGGVKVVDAKPPYEGKLQHVAVVIEPAIASFSQKNPLMTRLGKYLAEITYDVKVYDSTGEVILEKSYLGVGARNGVATHSTERNFETAAGLAMQDGVANAVKDIAATIGK